MSDTSSSHLWPAWPYPRIVSHRGGGKLAPENTLAAFEMGASLGLHMVEFDAKLSADNVVFLLHDDTVDRTSDGHGAAAQMTYAEIEKLDAGSWFDARFAGQKMPTLAQVAERCEALGLAANVEIKPCPGREAETGKRVAEAVRTLWAGQAVQPLLSSFSYEALEAAAAAAPELPRGMLYEAVPAHWRDDARKLGTVSLHASHKHLDGPQVAEIKAYGLQMLVYTVNDPARARELAAWGVDAICTDRIDLIGDDFLTAA
ncbi:glycerophosphodiester phosphodiesterase [Pandoraea pulmonicola]|uniref:Glycerophosphodiester phosphodiesterase n=1 Tax=Pandoraea pulmonicola TaxID=93221 RepID=A0AAJ4ZF87_PANPU|nr:glycerophosphodiester phosphodiesterase [Pandoraea pulmonicola]AJC19660.1 glycerophosphodiester phosphodiesterase [Pandoraea pulmonicola]SUA92229.1 Glycerophosphoryl diester phosphodiesterase [Pandoraea pulmonicola]